MEPNGLAESISAQIVGIIEAPAPYIATILVVAFIVWRIQSWRNAHSVEILEQRLTLRDDRIAEYERKLQGASPDEAKALIEKLQSEVDLLKPRRISPEQQDQITEALKGERGQLMIMADGTSPDARPLMEKIGKAFTNAGWTISVSNVMGPSVVSPSGYLAQVDHPFSLTAKQSEALSALRRAGLQVEVAPRRGSIPGRNNDLDLLISTPRQD